MVLFGKVLAKQSRFGNVGMGHVGQVGVVKAVEVSRVMSGSGAFWSVGARQASRGLLCRGHVRCDKEWIGSRGELQYVAVNRGMVGYVKAVVFSQGS